MLVDGFEQMIDEMEYYSKNGPPELAIYDSAGELSAFSQKCQFAKAMNILLGAFTGSGKTTLVDTYFILNAYWDYVKSSQRTAALPHWIYFILERGIQYKMAKWTSYLYKKEYGHIPGEGTITTAEIFNWKKKKFELSVDQKNRIKELKHFMVDMQKHVELKTGSKTAKDINEYCIDVAYRQGKMYEADTDGIRINGSKYVHKFSNGPFKTVGGKEVAQSTKVYEGNDRDKMNVVIIDHIGLVVPASGQNEKTVLDVLGKDCIQMRDLCGWTGIQISQFNDEMISAFRSRMNTKNDNGMNPFRIFKQDFKGTRTVGENADVVMGMMEPAVFKLKQYTNQEGVTIDLTNNYSYRELQIIKNTYGKLFNFDIDFDGRNGWIVETTTSDQEYVSPPAVKPEDFMSEGVSKDIRTSDDLPF